MPVGLRARRRARPVERDDGVARAGSAAFGARALPRRAAAAVLAPRPRAQPRARAARRAARRPVRGDRQRPLPPSRPRPPAGRVRRRAPALDARPDRAPAARQRLVGDGVAGRDGGALPRPSRRGRRDGAARGADRVRPHARPRLPLSRLGGPRGRPQARRAVPARSWTSATRAPPSSARPATAWTRSCA